ncbi:MAG: hypothetical protein Q9196_002777 [Gyalolechia fulgens]
MPRSTESSKTDLANTLRLFRILETHGMCFKNKALHSLPSAIDKAVKKVIRQDSSGDMRSVSAKKIIQQLALNKGLNETKIFHDFWRRLFKDLHTVPDSDHPGQSVDEDCLQGLQSTMNQLFNVGGVSVLKCDDKLDQELIDKLPQVKVPKPDIVYGIHHDHFSSIEKKAIELLAPWSIIANGVDFAFLVDEFKGDGTMEEAEAQDLRASSSVVNANRQIQNKAGMPDLDAIGVDASNIVFSFCAVPTLAKLYVHWAEVNVGADGKVETKFMMQALKSYCIDEQDGVKLMRRDLESILDWGTLARRNGSGGVKAVLEKIVSDKAKRPSESDGSRTQ